MWRPWTNHSSLSHKAAWQQAVAGHRLAAVEAAEVEVDAVAAGVEVVVADAADVAAEIDFASTSEP